MSRTQPTTSATASTTPSQSEQVDIADLIKKMGLDEKTRMVRVERFEFEDGANNNGEVVPRPERLIVDNEVPGCSTALRNRAVKLSGESQECRRERTGGLRSAPYSTGSRAIQKIQKRYY